MNTVKLPELPEALARMITDQSRSYAEGLDLAELCKDYARAAVEANQPESGGRGEDSEGAYTLATIADLLAVPVEVRDVCLRELGYGLALHELAYGDEARATLKTIVWRDDGKREFDLVDANGAEVLRMEIKDNPQPSAAVTEAMVEAGLDAALTATYERLPRYSVVRAIITAALSQGGKP